MILFSIRVGAVVIICVVAILLLIALINSIVIVHQTEAYIVERIGKYNATLDVGFHLIIPFFFVL